MKRRFSTALVVLGLALAPTGAMAGNGKGNAGGTNPADQDQGYARATFSQEVTTTTVTTERFMGMSDRTPPNARAAASQGVRSETTTTTTVEEVRYEVNGPKGQLDQGSSDCNTCETQETGRVVISVTSETETDGPGNSSH